MVAGMETQFDILAAAIALHNCGIISDKELRRARSIDRFGAVLAGDDLFVHQIASLAKAFQFND